MKLLILLFSFGLFGQDDSEEYRLRPGIQIGAHLGYLIDRPYIGIEADREFLPTHEFDNLGYQIKGILKLPLTRSRPI